MAKMSVLHKARNRHHNNHVGALYRPYLQATYLYLQPHSVEALQARIRAEILANPPLLYEPDEAATKAAAETAQEAEAAASKPQLFDAVVPLDPQVSSTLQLTAAASRLHLHWCNAHRTVPVCVHEHVCQHNATYCISVGFC